MVQPESPTAMTPRSVVYEVPRWRESSDDLSVHAYNAVSEELVWREQSPVPPAQPTPTLLHGFRSPSPKSKEKGKKGKKGKKGITPALECRTPSPVFGMGYN